MFRLKFNREVDGVVFDDSTTKNRVVGLKFTSGQEKHNQREYVQSRYVVCPGEAVGTVRKLGFFEPAYAGIAGASVKFTMKLSTDHLQKYQKLDHYLSYANDGINVVWQAKLNDDELCVGVGGTKAYYADIKPNLSDSFATKNNLLQLNIINEVLPDILSTALGRETTGAQLSWDDLLRLETAGLVKRWVGRRAVHFDAFPTFGRLHTEHGPVKNARCTTALGSGGVSLALVAAQTSRQADEVDIDELSKEILTLAASNRSALA